MCSRQRALLQAEYAYEKEEFQRLTEATGVRRKVERGIAWFPLSVGHCYRNSLDQIVVEIHKTSSEAGSAADPDDLSQFEPGKPVCFFTEDASGDRHGTGGLLTYFKWVGQVSYVEEDRMVIALPSADVYHQQSSSLAPVPWHEGLYTVQSQQRPSPSRTDAKTSG